MIKGVFFDLGGTLFSYKKMQTGMMDLFAKMVDRFSLEHDVTEVAHVYNLVGKEVDLEFAQMPFFLGRDYFKANFERYLERIGKPEFVSHFDWYEVLFLQTMDSSFEIQPDCHATLEKLKSIGLYLSIVSNIDDNMLNPLIERERLDRWFTHMTSSEAAKSCKPDLQFFRVALQKSSLSANEVMFVGDSLEQDILGAHAMGMHTTLISEPGQSAPMHVGKKTPEPDYRISRLSELPGIITGLA